MDIRKPISGIAVFSFTCSLIVYVFINDHILVGFSTNPTILKTLIEFFSALGVYTLIFTILHWFYSRYFFRIFDRRYSMDGKWYQIFLINPLNPTDDRIRCGPCKIESSIDGITISGINYHVDKNNKFSSMWQSEISKLNGSQLTLMYISNGHRRENSSTLGTMSFSLYGSPPTKLIGNFFDSTPATHYGPIFLYKSKSEYDSDLKSFIESNQHTV